MRNPSSYLTAAEETLGMSSAQRGLGGMQRTAANPGPNMFDSGAASKVAVTISHIITLDYKSKTLDRTLLRHCLKLKLMQ